MNLSANNQLYAVWLEKQVTKLLEADASTRSWADIDKTKLPRQAFLWVEDVKKKSTWHLPYREGAGGINPDTGMFAQAGAVNLGALRAIAAVMGGARTGKPMTVPPEIRSKIRKLLKKYKIGRFKEERTMKTEGVTLRETFIGNEFVAANLDKEHRRIRNVAILRPTSSNKSFKESKGRKYSRQAREMLARITEGAKAYVNHATQKELEDANGVRKIEDLFGYYEGGRVDSDGVVRSDLIYLEHQKEFVESLVEGIPDKIGNSIHAIGDLAFDQNSQMEIVENIKELFSIDLVTEPGSTANLFENLDRGDEMKIEELTLTELREKRPELITEIAEEVSKNLDEKGKMKGLETKLKESDEKNKKLEKELDEHNVKEKIREREAHILELIEESKLDKEFVTDPFMDSLRAAKDEEATKALLEDRKKLVEAGKNGGVKKMGDENDKDRGDEKTWKKEVKEAAGIATKE